MAQSEPSCIPFWLAHVSAGKVSGLSQKNYCQEQGLAYSAFGCWVRKLHSQVNDRQPSRRALCLSHGCLRSGLAKSVPGSHP